MKLPVAAHSMRRLPSRKIAKLGAVASGVTAVGMSMVFVYQSSYAAYSATTSNAANSWATGSVAIVDDDSGTAMFTATNLVPSSTGNKCIVVTYNGSAAAAVKLYGTGNTSTNSLGGSIDLVVTSGTGGSFGSCVGYSAVTTLYTGTLTGFTAANYAGGLGVWSPATSETRSYQFTYTVNAAAPNTTQSSTAAIGFTWEAQTP